MIPRGIPLNQAGVFTSMSVLFCGEKGVQTLLLWQFITVVVSGVLFTLKDNSWSVSAITGGLAVWLPNLFFMVSASRLSKKQKVTGRIAWSFALAEGLKLIVTISLLLVALRVFGAGLIPIVLTWLSLLVVQILASVVINNRG